MECISPRSIKNPKKGAENMFLSVPCGTCPICLENHRASWTFRLTQEQNAALTSLFITLTYDELKSPSLEIRDIQGFLKRLRYYMDVDYQKRLKMPEIAPEMPKMKYFIVGEYGTKYKRPHYHGIFFNLPMNCSELINQAWKHGFIRVDPLNDARINYVTGYILSKRDYPEGTKKPFATMSLKPPIGMQYLEKNMNYHKNGKKFIAVLKGGKRVNLPRIYKHKIFDENERSEHYNEVKEIRYKKGLELRRECYKNKIPFYQNQDMIIREIYRKHEERKLKHNKNEDTNIQFGSIKETKNKPL
ncbi:MAG: replication initiator protein [Microviridae sp.]|nr:MAG: replication initiator protein [Microviridae sp.]